MHHQTSDCWRLAYLKLGTERVSLQRRTRELSNVRQLPPTAPNCPQLPPTVAHALGVNGLRPTSARPVAPALCPRPQPSLTRRARANAASMQTHTTGHLIAAPRMWGTAPGESSVGSRRTQARLGAATGGVHGSLRTFLHTVPRRRMSKQTVAGDTLRGLLQRERTTPSWQRGPSLRHTIRTTPYAVVYPLPPFDFLRACQYARRTSLFFGR